MVGMARCAVPARVVAGGTNVRATLAIEGVAPLHAARTSQRDVPTTLTQYRTSDSADCISALGVSNTRLTETKRADRKALSAGRSASSRASAVVGDERICVR